MFRYEDEVFGDSEPELDEGEISWDFKIQGFCWYQYSLMTWKVWNLQKFDSVTESKPLFSFLFFFCLKNQMFFIWNFIKIIHRSEKKNSLNLILYR